MGGRSGKRARPTAMKKSAGTDVIPAPHWSPVRPGLSYTLVLDPAQNSRELLKLEGARAPESDDEWKE